MDEHHTAHTGNQDNEVHPLSETEETRVLYGALDSFRYVETYIFDFAQVPFHWWSEWSSGMLNVIMPVGWCFDFRYCRTLS